MTTFELALLGFNSLASLIALARTFRRPKLTLEQAAEIAFDSGEQLGKTPAEKRSISLHALDRLDRQDGHRDWPDHARMLALEAVVKRRKVRAADPAATR